jgi:hypothetical protein
MRLTLLLLCTGIVLSACQKSTPEKKQAAKSSAAKAEPKTAKSSGKLAGHFRNSDQLDQVEVTKNAIQIHRGSAPDDWDTLNVDVIARHYAVHPASWLRERVPSVGSGLASTADVLAETVPAPQVYFWHTGLKRFVVTQVVPPELKATVDRAEKRFPGAFSRGYVDAFAENTDQRNTPQGFVGDFDGDNQLDVAVFAGMNIYWFSPGRDEPGQHKLAWVGPQIQLVRNPTHKHTFDEQDEDGKVAKRHRVRGDYFRLVSFGEGEEKFYRDGDQWTEASEGYD